MIDTKCNEPGCNLEGIPCREPMAFSRRERLHDLWLLFRRRDLSALLYQTWRWLRYDLVDVITYYCPSHCYKNGFCYGCGQFWSGADDRFDFGESHLCTNCYHEFAEDFRDDADDDDGGYWRDPMDIDENLDE